MENRLKISLCLGGAIFCIGLAGAGIHFFSGRWEDQAPTAVAGPALTLQAGKTATHAGNDLTRPPSQRYAYVTGAVANPGMYPLSGDMSVGDLITAAGGLRPNAETSRINLSAPVRDGSHIHVRTVSSSKNSNKNSKSSVSDLSSRTRKHRRKSTAKEPHYVYINKADAEELRSLPGIGPKLAARIVEYRSRHGAFESPEALLNISGIGRITLDKFRAFLRF